MTASPATCFVRPQAATILLGRVDKLPISRRRPSPIGCRLGPVLSRRHTWSPARTAETSSGHIWLRPLPTYGCTYNTVPSQMDASPPPR
ncbi:hypothetical protein XA68_13771 [Ophiocordyceps unilateralis]|uniref:Uncharacterized protein n=1 Tax=Ophiocordyceps unilateralis TaxID=268505 RepID=A0A2A9PQH6_OPHUN|nr:hypothetical protein XA68_13771 [Ophiocordyceps unilateralis]